MRNYKKALATVTIVFGAVACGDPAGPPSAPASPTAALSSGRGNSPGQLSPFYNVGIQAEAFAVNAYFQYAGNKGTPSLIIATTAEFGSSVVATVPAKNMNNGYWLARIEKLNPGTQYYLELTDGHSTWLGSARTYRRQVIIDVDTVHVSFDGDAGAPCGEMIFRTYVNPIPWWDPGETVWTSKWHDVCSGEKIVLSDAEGRTVLTNWTAAGIQLHLSVFESDSCWAIESFCGDLDYGAEYLDYDVSGGVKSYIFKMTTSASSYVKVMWVGTVKTTFVPW